MQYFHRKASSLSTCSHSLDSSLSAKRARGHSRRARARTSAGDRKHSRDPMMLFGDRHASNDVATFQHCLHLRQCTCTPIDVRHPVGLFCNHPLISAISSGEVSRLVLQVAVEGGKESYQQTSSVASVPQSVPLFASSMSGLQAGLSHAPSLSHRIASGGDEHQRVGVRTTLRLDQDKSVAT